VAKAPEIHGWLARKLTNDAVDLVKRTGAKRILLLGPPGTGKELLADHIAQRAMGEEIKLKYNLAGMPEGLVSSQLFGYVKGAFSGAAQDAKGIFHELGKDDVIFLDEVGDAPPEAHRNLLRVLEYDDFFRVGATKPERLEDNVRVIAATCHPDFRPDLRDRFELTLETRPLLECTSDIPPLVAHFVRQYNETKPEGQRFTAVSPIYFSCLLLRAHMLQDVQGEKAQEPAATNVRWLRRTVLQDCARVCRWWESLDEKERGSFAEQCEEGLFLWRVSPRNDAVPWNVAYLHVDSELKVWAECPLWGGFRLAYPLGPLREAPLSGLASFLITNKMVPDNWEDVRQQITNGSPSQAGDYELWLPAQHADALARVPIPYRAPGSLAAHVLQFFAGKPVTLEKLAAWNEGDYFQGDEDDKAILKALLEGASFHQEMRNWGAALFCTSMCRSDITSQRLPSLKEFMSDAERAYLQFIGGVPQNEMAKVAGVSLSTLKDKRKEHGLSKTRAANKKAPKRSKSVRKKNDREPKKRRS